MKKLVLAAFVTLSGSCLIAEDQYLMWMLGETITVDEKQYSLQSGDSVRIAVADAGGAATTTYLNLYGNPGETTFGTVTDAGDAQIFSVLAGVTDYSNSSFVFELINGSDVIGQSGPVAYGSLGAYISNMKFGHEGSLKGAYSVNAFTAVPEPTSGLLLLIGVAGLALRRKNKKA